MPERLEKPTQQKNALIEALARIIDPDAYAEDALDIVEDVPVARAQAWVYASRVAAWLPGHDRETAEYAVTNYGLVAGRALLSLLPPNPYRPAARDQENGRQDPTGSDTL